MSDIFSNINTKQQQDTKPQSNNTNTQQIQQHIDNTSTQQSNTQLNDITKEQTSQNINAKIEKQQIQELEKELTLLNENPILKNYVAFSYTRVAETLIVEIKDRKTNEIIKQYPTQEFLKRKEMEAFIVNEKA